ncbi:MAG: hypothetical protein Q9184_005347 [Pyrenodesmia sp. 2 TL-2023]
MYARRLKFMEALERKVFPLERYHVDVVGLNEDTREEITFLRKKLGISSPAEMVRALGGKDDGVHAENHDLDGAISLHIERDAARGTETERDVELTPLSDPDDEHTSQPPTQLNPVPNRPKGKQIPRTSILSNVFRRTSNHQDRVKTPTRLQMMLRTQTGDPAADPSPRTPRRLLSKANRIRHKGDTQNPLSIGVSANFQLPEELPLPIVKSNEDPTMRNTFANAKTGTYFVEEEGSELTEESDAASVSSVFTYDGARDLVKRRRGG